MCGIVGYIGKRRARDYIIQGLKILEYRGYDSAGLAVFDGCGKINCIKRAGYVSQLESATIGTEGNCGIGHTRWATHGAPSDVNSHPHTCGKFTLVHNGIIENFVSIKSQLANKGKRFLTQTDSEAIAVFLDDVYDGDVIKALSAALKKLKGSFALAILCKDFPDKIFVVKKQSPLVVGIGDAECFVASDCMAFSQYTDKAVYLKDNEIGEVSSQGIKLFDGNGNRKAVKIEKTATEYFAPADCKSFMYKEIYEIPKAVQYTAEEFFANDEKKLGVVDIFSKNDKVVMIGCGTAYNACLVGKNIFETVLRVPVEVELASEFRYKNPIIDDKTVVVAVSQSGETADTIAGVRLAKSKGADVVVITNVAHSSITRYADMVLHTKAGAEVAVAATKSYLTQILLFLCVATVLSDDLKSVAAIKKEIESLPQLTQKTLALDEQVHKLAKEFCKKQSVFFIGRGLDYALALEGTLKLKEVSYIHSEGFASGELKHGTLALIDKNALVIAVVTQRHVAEKTCNALHEVQARGGKVVVITPFEKAKNDVECDAFLQLPSSSGLIAPMSAIIPLQLFAYYMSVERGINPDKPRNLAKSVTVE